MLAVLACCTAAVMAAIAVVCQCVVIDPGGRPSLCGVAAVAAIAGADMAVVLALGCAAVVTALA